MEMKKYVVIGAGISGLSIAKMLQDLGNEIVVFDSSDRPGGMIKCDYVEGNLFHRTGGHVFNTKRADVMGWFWKHFDRESEFRKIFRNSVVCLDEKRIIPYPIENHVYYLEENILKSFINDLLNIYTATDNNPENFDDFLRMRFGETLYHLYFQPYNYKVWRRDLKKVPLSWLSGKLPMPTVQEMLYNNINHIEEREFVHSSFYYPHEGGSQFLADRISEGLNIYYNITVENIVKKSNKWIVEGIEADAVIFCGNLKQIPYLLTNAIDLQRYIPEIDSLESHGTTSVFCEIKQNPYSWIYLPNSSYESHRIICTGNFSSKNNSVGKMTGTIEFTDYISIENILDNLNRIPGSPKYLAHHYEKYTYPIQQTHTREMISSLKHLLEKHNLFLLGRFAEWEYYNMDVAIGAAIDLLKKIYR